MAETLEKMFRELLENQRMQGREIDALASNITSLVRELEQDERFHERAEIVAEKERDKQHKSIVDKLDMFEAALALLPESVLIAVEKQIYALRVARHEAHLSGVSNGAAPLLPTPVVRESTEKIKLRLEENVSLTPEQQHVIVKGFRYLWEFKWHGLVASGGALAHWFAVHWHDLVQAALK